MKKLLAPLVALLYVAFFAYAPVLAIDVEPRTGVYPPNSVVTVVVSAYEDIGDSQASAVQVRLTVDGPGSTIVAGSWDDRDSDNYLSIGTCTTNQDNETSTSICVDMAKTNGYVAGGETLGSFRIRLGGEGVTKVQEAEGNGYLIGNNISGSETGRNLAQFTVEEGAVPTPTPLPITGIEDYPILLIAGFVIIFSGIGFFVWRDRAVKVSSE